MRRDVRPAGARPVTLLIGAHTPEAGGIAMAVRRAGAAGMTAVQVFTAPPQYYGEKVGVKPDRLARFREACAATGIPPAHVLVHAGYVLNTASPEPEKWAKAANGLAKELERSTILGTYGCCFHPGSAGKADRDAGIARVADAMTRALEAAPPGTTRLLVENTAGAGATIGRTAEEVAAILARIPAAQRGRAGYGLDTCHLFASGHPIHESPAQLAAVLDAFEQATGEPPAFFHLNDSEGALGSNRDRHRLIGEGEIGVEPFRWLLHDRRARGVPLILETPQARDDWADDDASADAYDVRMVELLRTLAA
ncbi:MAG: deoxyribonuclease IV [Gemmatimonadota bacterium]|jgi:deoxyribonuclease-4|nr:deoxyribonuclease IV [Gemmatimonadota bacterium]